MLEPAEEQQQSASTSNVEADVMERNEEEANEETMQEQHFSGHPSSNPTIDHASYLAVLDAYRTMLFYTALASTGQLLLSQSHLFLCLCASL
uniref:Uncharacterized protein n=1 Tax=Mesocestoides corti TaxID=53468 RepID=A0A5K3F906_MESCO